MRESIEIAPDTRASPRCLVVIIEQDTLGGAMVALRDISGTFAKCRPHQVTFYKRLPNSSGHVCNVEVARVYLSPAVKKGD